MLGVRRLEYQRAEGQLIFDFGQTGRATITAMQYAVTVIAKVRFVGDVETTVTFDGVIEGDYSAIDGLFTLTNVERRDFSMVAATPFGDFDAGSDDFFADGSSTYVCESDGGIRLYPGDETETPILLRRPATNATPAAT